MLQLDERKLAALWGGRKAVFAITPGELARVSGGMVVNLAVNK